MSVGSALYASELAFTWLWSVAEVAVACARRGELPPDPHAARVARDIDERGFYVDVPDAPVLRNAERSDARFVVGENPYRFLRPRDGTPDRVVARVIPSRRVQRARRLLVVHHCYGLPSPRAMSALFGLRRVEDCDIAYAIMSHHQRRGYPLWPGTGFVSANPACTLENLRAAVAGARTLVRGLVAARGYEEVSVLGYSIGGQLALHLANTERIDRALLYCPVVSVHRIGRELGLLRNLHPHLLKIARRRDPSYPEELLALGDPLRYPLAIPESRVEVIAQRYDAMTSLAHVGAIRDKYPGVVWHEMSGSHLFPLGRGRVHGIIRGAAEVLSPA